MQIIDKQRCSETYLYGLTYCYIKVNYINFIINFNIMDIYVDIYKDIKAGKLPYSIDLINVLNQCMDNEWKYNMVMFWMKFYNKSAKLELSHLLNILNTIQSESNKFDILNFWIYPHNALPGFRMEYKLEDITQITNLFQNNRKKAWDLLYNRGDINGDELYNVLQHYNNQNKTLQINLEKEQKFTTHFILKYYLYTTNIVDIIYAYLF